MKQMHFLVRVAGVALAILPVSAQVINLNSAPSRVLGSLRVGNASAAPNLVEGRELNTPNGVALDTTASPPILYVADTGNNRVLAWRDATSARNGVQADLVIGQRDFISTTAYGGGALNSSGFSLPSGLTVDRNGNLWVADSGSHRVIRFPRPFSQPSSDVPFPDIVVGQESSIGRTANNGQPSVNEKGFSFGAGNSFFRVGIAVDGTGNLWVADPGNHRVLRFAASSLTRNGPSADLVVGQTDFTSRVVLPAAAANRTRKDAMNTPSAVALDPQGRVFVSDLLGRVLVYVQPLANGSGASRIMGVNTTTGAPPVNQISIGVTVNNTLGSAEGIFFVGNSPMIVDTVAHRILRFPPIADWPNESTQFSPSAQQVIGQPDFTSGRLEGGQTEVNGNGFTTPVGATANATGEEIYVADVGNHRVVRLAGAPNYRTPLQVWGQIAFNLDSPNLVEGREFFFHSAFGTISGVSASLSNGAALAFDNNRLYVADALNNRVLGFRDSRAFKNGDRADIVIGQPDLFRSVINFPTNDVNAPTDMGLFQPSGLAVDTNGDLWVADTGNGRVLRFPKPFENPPNAGSGPRANLVIGQISFTSKNTDPSVRTMARPFGLAFIPEDGSLAVGDSIHNRILVFRKQGGDFVTGQSAAVVIGQPDFSSTATALDNQARLISPRGMAADTDNRLYVADTAKNRVVIYDRITALAQNDPAPALTLSGISSPHGIFVSQSTGEIWVADTIGNRALHYPRFSQLVLNPVPDAAVAGRTPLGVALDRFGNLYLGEAANRIAIYYPALTLFSSANDLPTTLRGIAPNTWTQLKPVGGTRFSEATQVFSELPNPLPMPRDLLDTQVLLNDAPAALHFVSPGQINFYVPNTAPTSGTMEVLVIRPSTGQILATGNMAMAPTATGLFTNAGNGNGQLAALNQDNTRNSAENPAQRGSVIQLFGSGFGFVPNAPPDGTAAEGLINIEKPEIVVIGSAQVPAANVEYSGFAPTLVGLWQINVRIPDNTVPGAVPCNIVLRSVNNQEPRAPFNQRTIIHVRQ